MRTFMMINKPFGEEIDDDGLPKYSPDRNNIVAYHMYKLGLTDKLPDPEETHTPFFRTPSWYEEKAQRQRQDEAGLSPKPEVGPGRIEPVKPDSRDFFGQYPIKGNVFPFHKKPAFPPSATAGQPFASNYRDPDGHHDTSGPFGQKGEPGNHIPAPLDGYAFGQQVLRHIFGGGTTMVPNGGLDKGLPGQAFLGTGMKGELRSGQSGEEQPVFTESRNVPEKVPQRPEETEPAMTVDPPVKMDKAFLHHEQADNPSNAFFSDIPAEMRDGMQNLLYVPDKAQVQDESGKPPDDRRLEWMSARRENEEDRWTSGLFPLLIFRPEQIGRGRVASGASGKADLAGMKPVREQNGAQPVKEEAQGWMNGDDSGTGDQPAEDGSPDGEFDPDGLEPPSAGRPLNKPFRSVFANDNAANPGFVPLQVALLSPGQLPIPKGRREVSIEMTHDINSRLTRLNRGWPIGINFTVLSRLEGGSSAYANLPIAGKELDLERREKMEAMKRGVPPPQRKRANNSGVTIGSGFDLGQTSADEMRGMGFDESFIQKCAPYIGKKRVAADDELRKRPLVLTDKEIDQVNDIVMMDKAQKSIQDWDSRIARLKKTMPNAPFFHEMNSAQQTIVFSRYYQQGTRWHQRRANKPMFESMQRNDWETVNRQMQGLSNGSGPRWLKDRFRREWWFLYGKH